MTQGESLKHFDLNSLIKGNVRGAIGSKRKITSSSSGLLSGRSGGSSVENLINPVHEEDSSVTDLVSERKLLLFSISVLYPDVLGN